MQKKYLQALGSDRGVKFGKVRGAGVGECVLDKGIGMGKTYA